MRKSEMSSPRASSSSSSSSANMMTMNILSRRTRKPPDSSGKKQRTELSPEVEILCEVGTEKSSIHDLPSEMLMKILKNLDFQSLLHCRLLSVNWNAVATDVCRSRSDLDLQFHCYRDNNRKLVIENKLRKTSLLEFIESFGSSKHFPFARFHFDGVTWSTFRRKDWSNFLFVFKENIKGLKFTSSNALAKKTKPGKDNGLLKLITELRDLLSNQLPKLQEFGLQLHPCDPKSNLNAAKVRLFPKPLENPDPDSQNQMDTPSFFAKGEQQQQQLSHLKVLYLDESMFSDYTEIVTDLLLAAVKLQKIQPFKTGLEKYNDQKNFFFLQSLGKLDCLASVEIHLTSEFLNKVKVKVNGNEETQAPTPAPLVFKFKTLDVNVRFLYKKPSGWSDATIYLCFLFDSNKNSLRELTMDPLGFLEDLPLPKFSRLTDLCVAKQNSNSNSINESIFPPGIELNFIFPALNSLNLEIPWATAFPHEDFVSPIPTLRTLKIIGTGLDESSIAQISFMCPDLKNFFIADGKKGPLKNFPDVGTAIWTNLTKLQSLELGLDVGSRSNAFPALDSCITGISVENLERLHDCIEADKMLRKWGIEGRVLKSEMTAEREYPSILNLKDLKNLRFRLTSLDSTSAGKNLLSKAITCISEENAFKMMKNLSYEIQQIYS